MRRAARFDNRDIQKELRDIDTTQPHAIHFLKKYNNKSVTENGAVGFKTTGQPLLDLNFKVSSLRKIDPYQSLIRVLDSPRYTKVEEALKVA